MKPILVVGLGNPLMGDDGVGCAVAECLVRDPRLPEWADVIAGGSDLLRYAGLMEGRRLVVVLDAIQDEAAPGTVATLDENAAGLEMRQEHAHHISALQAMRLLSMTIPADFLLLAISIASAGIGTDLSSRVRDRLPAIVEKVLGEIEYLGAGKLQCS